MKPFRAIAEPGTADWYRLRQTGIGSSEAAAAVGKSQWATPLDVYLRKVGITPEFSGNIKTRCGKALEPVIKELFEEQTGKKIDPVPMLRSVSDPWMLATADGFVGSDEGVECKNTAYERDPVTGDVLWGEPGTDDIPDEVMYQAQHQMFVSGRKLWWVPVLIEERDFRIYRVERCDDFIDWLRGAELELWNRVLEEIPPEVNPDHRAALRAVKALYAGKVDPVGVILSDAARKLQSRREGIKETIKDLAKEVDSIAVELLAEIGDAQFGVLGDGMAIKRIPIDGCEYTVKKEAHTQIRTVKQPKTLVLRETP
jgi:putative phage-type endonuclease